MNRLIETKNVFKQITKEIIAKCAASGQNISSACALRILKITIQNPEYEFGSEMMTRSQIQQLISTCVHKLTDSVGSSSRTIEMQVYFSSHYAPRDEIVVEHHQTVLSRTEPLMAEIRDWVLLSGEEMKNLYRKLVVVITLLSGLGNPTAGAVLKEATAALHSVFPLSELSRFTTLSDSDKTKQVDELKQIVSGIRLFNRDSHKGGEGIDDMPTILQQAVVATRDLLLQCIQETQDKTEQITGWLENVYNETVRQDMETLDVKTNFPVGVTEDDVTTLKENIAHLVQYSIYLNTLLEDVKASEKDIVILCAHVNERLLQLHDTVRYRTAIPTNQVYPQFMDLAVTWFSLQDQMVVLSTINQILYTLQNMSKVPQITEEKLELLDNESKLISRLSLMDKVKKIRPSKVKCEVLELVNIENCDKKKIQYFGHCAYRFAEMDGCLFPGELSLGLLRYKGYLFAFSSVEAAYSFGEDPDKYYQKGLDIVVRRPELIVLFDMDQQTQNLKPTSKIPTMVVQKCDSAVQTELHPVPTRMDPSYSCNTWDYKRQALHLADLCKKATHSSQTGLSHKRLTIGVQACPSRCAAVQTRKESGANTEQPHSFIPTLRGHWPAEMFQTNRQWTYLPDCYKSEAFKE